MPKSEEREYNELRSRMLSIRNTDRGTYRQARRLAAALERSSPENGERAVNLGVTIGVPMTMEIAIKRMAHQSPQAAEGLRKILEEIFEGRPRAGEQVPLHKPPPREDPWRTGSFVHFHD